LSLPKKELPPPLWLTLAPTLHSNIALKINDFTMKAITRNTSRNEGIAISDPAIVQ
jgi:hypothetical protein